MTDKKESPFSLDVNEERIKAEYTSDTDNTRIKVDLPWKKVAEVLKELLGEKTK